MTRTLGWKKWSPNLHHNHRSLVTWRQSSLSTVCMMVHTINLSKTTRMLSLALATIGRRKTKMSSYENDKKSKNDSKYWIDSRSILVVAQLHFLSIFARFSLIMTTISIRLAVWLLFVIIIIIKNVEELDRPQVTPPDYDDYGGDSRNTDSRWRIVFF